MMKVCKWIALLLTGVLLTACNAGAAEVTTVAPSESSVTTPRKTTASDMTTTSYTATCDCGAHIDPIGVTGEARDQLLAGKTGMVAAGMIDQGSIRVIGATVETAGDVYKLFDRTTDEWQCQQEPVENQNPRAVWVIFAATKSVKVTAYEMITGAEVAQQQPVNPIEWTLYGSNDPAALTAEDPQTVEWVALDYVYDGGMIEDNLISHGVAVDEARQGEYRYYAWVAGYACNGWFCLSELELYYKS